MPGINTILNTSKEALLAHLAAINVTGSNIANVSTPGYSRLRPVFGSVSVLNPTADQLQLGVKITDIERLYDKFLEVQIVQQEQDVTYSNTTNDVLKRVEAIFNESRGGGISELLGKFWNAWHDLSANPGGQAEREVLGSISQSLGAMFRERANELFEVQKDVNTAISDAVRELNSYLEEMANYNNRIIQVEISGDTATDLRDKRSELLKKMSGLINLSYFEGTDGALNIFLSNGKALVEGNSSWKLDVVENPAEPHYYNIVFKDNPSEILNSHFTKGKLGGLVELRDTTLDDYIDNLDSLAAGIILQVNAQHQLGYDVNGNMGGNFFVPATQARDMQVSADIIADSGKIAAAATVNGDADNARLISSIKDKCVMESGTKTLGSYYHSFIGQIGYDADEAGRGSDRQSSIMSQLNNQKEGISGVSLDEEMLNLIKYQLGYNAAARISNIASEMIDTLLALSK